MNLEVKTYQHEKVFFEAMWLGYEDSDEPIVRGSDVKKIIDKLLHITRDQSGTIEVYKFTYNKLGHRIQLHSKFEVFNELDLFIE